MDAQPRSPQDDDQPAEAAAVRAVSGGADNGDDLLDLRRIRRVAQSFVTRRPTLCALADAVAVQRGAAEPPRRSSRECVLFTVSR